MPSFLTRGISPRLLCVSLLSHVVLAAAPECTTLSRGNLVACALAHSPLLAAELATSRAVEGRREAARPFLPDNPTLAGSLSSRTGPGQLASVANWSLTLSQQVEIAGQSWLRVGVAERELAAQGHQVAVASASVAEQVWLAWFDALAAKERAALAAKLEQQCLAVALTVKGMAEHGLASSVDAAVADAAAVRASRDRFEAVREVSAGEVRLRSLLGAQGRVELSGELSPLKSAGLSDGARPELLALEATSRAAASRIELLRRGRVPNLTLSLFAQNDGFDERVLGVGLGVPIPLPQPIGRTRAGEIAEAVGQQGRTQAELDQLSRAVGSERELAQAAWESSLQTVALFTPERLGPARQALAAITEQLAAGRLSVRDALVDQRALVELLQGEVDARHALCAASVRLVRAAGGSLEGGDL